MSDHVEHKMKHDALKFLQDCLLSLIILELEKAFYQCSGALKSALLLLLQPGVWCAGTDGASSRRW
jgi:hypothetical protein